MSLMRDSKVVVAGAAGLTGMHFIDALLPMGARIKAVIHKKPLPKYGNDVEETMRADLLDSESCRAAFRGADVAILSAAFVVGSKVAVENPIAIVNENLFLGARMLEACVLEGVKRVLLIGSSTTYPPYTYPVQEHEWNDPPAPVYQGIGNVKRFQEVLAKFYYDRYGLEVAIVRPTAIYGEYDHFDGEARHVIPALIMRALSGENPFGVWGTGEEIRDFVHAADVARAGIMALEQHAVCDPLNVGGGQPATIGEVARIVLDICGKRDTPITFDPTKPTTIPVRMVDISKIQRILGFEPRISLQEGLSRTINWYLNTLQNHDRS